MTLISDSHPEEFLAGGKHLTSSALDELVASIVHWSFEICGDAASPQSDHHNHTAPAAVPTTSHLSDDQRSVTSATEIQSNPAIPNDSESLATATAAKLVLSDTRCVILSRQVNIIPTFSYYADLFRMKTNLYSYSNYSFQLQLTTNIAYHKFGWSLNVIYAGFSLGLVAICLLWNEQLLVFCALSISL